MSRTIGILGGMGPLATVDLFEKITRLTQASLDQEHLHVIVDSDPGIPDRIGAILSGTESPVPRMTESALRLETAGADLMVMACNTAHYFYEDIRTAIHIPFLHMPREAAGVLAGKGIRCAAVLGTTALLQAGIYDQALKQRGMTALHPKEELQRRMMHQIFDGIKAGNRELPLQDLPERLEKMQHEGAELFILACTELPFLFQREELRGFPVLDPAEELAKAAVRAAGGRVRGDR